MLCGIGKEKYSNLGLMSQALHMVIVSHIIILPASRFHNMAEAEGLVVHLTEDDISGASLPELTEEQSVPTLKWLLLCQGILIPAIQERSSC